MEPLKIIDCFIFFSEIELLKFRLKELQDVVDYFVIVESNKTFSNNPKPYNFENSLEELKLLFNDGKVLEKIIYVKVEDLPQDGDAWSREAYQRNCIKRGLDLIPNLTGDDVLIITDADEIPDPDKLDSIKNRKVYYNNPIRLQQDMYYYNFNCKANIPNTTALLIEYKHLGFFEDINKIVRTYWYHTTDKFGWHLSYFGDSKWIVEKIKAFSHQEYNNETYTNEETINELIKNCQDLFFRDNKSTHDFNFKSIKENDYLPKNYEMILKNEL